MVDRFYCYYYFILFWSLSPFLSFYRKGKKSLNVNLSETKRFVRKSMPCLFVCSFYSVKSTANFLKFIFMEKFNQIFFFLFFSSTLARFNVTPSTKEEDLQQ